ncbi:hypothetical protein BJ980_001059 [Nocardioides daedukensis]|uniref:HNH endonuclease n=1 Tax=Nocardioides daedukensis TaxID=634462 RepID=A0A7Y9UQ18_9ACTN|nr:HNH endonuclease signature motif containing protein [Nocardioides daedukensis]NYG58136.1 hypothetical protein [Nocardioides daedukensis]
MNPASELPTCETADAVLGDAARLRRVADDAERGILMRAVQWADLHPAPEGDDPAPGARDEASGRESDAHSARPAVAWDSTAEFALSVGIPPSFSDHFFDQCLELRHRLPRTWSRVLSGELTAWRARRIADVTLNHPVDVATYVDEHVWAIAHKVGLITLAKLLDEAMLALYPEERERERLDALDRRQVRLLKDISANGVATMIIEADLKDALDFNDTVSKLAHLLKEAGCEEPLDVRRALAIGILADPGRALDLLEGSGESEGKTPRERRKKMTIVLHLADAALSGLGGGHVGRIERGAKPISVEMIRDWCGRTDTAVTVLPIVDDRDHVDVERYEIPDRLTDQADRRSPCCVFPWCHRSSVACDHDHGVPFGAGGMTCSCNIAPLCRRHHRLKTHTAWSYDVLEPGAYLWHSPFGRTYFRDNLGTADVTLPGEVDDHNGCFDTRDPDLAGTGPDTAGTGPPGIDPERLRQRVARMRERMARVHDVRGCSRVVPDFQPTDFLPWDITDDDDPATAPRRPGEPVPPGERDWQRRPIVEQFDDTPPPF